MSRQHPLDEAASFLEGIRQARVLCIGDAMLDCTVEGSVERISPEAPIPVLRMECERAVLGGAANVVANLASLGARATLVSIVGDDPEGNRLERLLAGQAEPALVRDRARPTIVKTRYVAGNQQMLRVDRELAGRPDAIVLEELLGLAIGRLAAADVLIISDYGKGVVDAAVTIPLIEAAQRSGKPILVDPKGRDYGRYRGATVVTPNRSELVTAAGRELADDAAVASAAAVLRASIGVDWLLTTLGGAGMLLVGADSTVRIAGVRREVYDVVGAGDTVLATMAALVAAGAAIPPAAWLANLAGSVVVGRRGTATISDTDLRAALAEQRGTQHESKILGRDAAERLVGETRARGRRIGFTNGCFDILHPGHVSLIAQARLRCDMLVVGLNSDASVRRLKGPERPVNDEQARAHVLAALAGVDAVVVFEEDTPLDLIHRLRPDLLVKGADYRVDQVVGGDDVRSWGGEIFLAELLPGRSTTATIARIGKAT